MDLYVVKVTGRDDILRDGVAWVGPYETSALAYNGAERIVGCNPDDYCAVPMLLDDMEDEYIPHIDANGVVHRLPGEFLSELYFTHCF